MFFVGLKIFIKFWLPPVLWAGLIFYLSSIPQQPQIFANDLSFWQDFVLKKFLHLIEYGILTFLTVRAFSAHQSKNLPSTVWGIKKILFYSFVVVLLFAISDEYHQTLVPGREGTLRDVLIDSIAIAAVAFKMRENLKTP